MVLKSDLVHAPAVTLDLRRKPGLDGFELPAVKAIDEEIVVSSDRA